jgi:transposase InsO family protein
MCRVLEVSSSGYYGWLSQRERRQSKRQEKQDQYDTLVNQAFIASQATYGSPRLRTALRTRGICTSRRRIRQSMERQCLESKHNRRRYRCSTTAEDPQAEKSPNILNREFVRSKQDDVWCSDITYIPTVCGFVYLTVILDLYSHRVISWTLSDTLEAEKTVIRAFLQAVGRRLESGGSPPMMFHSDRGSQYTSNGMRSLLADFEVLQSMSRKGNCWDNAVAESFFKTLKTEYEFSDRLAVNQEEVFAAVFRYIDCFYNSRRIHSAVGGISPLTFEQNALLQP